MFILFLIAFVLYILFKVYFQEKDEDIYFNEEISESSSEEDNSSEGEEVENVEDTCIDTNRENPKNNLSDRVTETGNDKNLIPDFSGSSDEMDSSSSDCEEIEIIQLPPFNE